MKGEIETLARYRLSRAEEAWRDAVVLLGRNSLISAVNRFYYAAFYAARALLATEEIDSSRHSGIITLFNQHFVKTGRIPVEVGKVLSRSFEKRLDTDYEDFASLEQDEVEQIKEDVRKFVTVCQQVFEAMVGKQPGE